MTDDSGDLSVDFLVGFTIFMMAFIWVATLVPNLFLGVSAHGIDFDAVAYRTGVILAEDPGATNASATGPWELQHDSGKGLIERFGLAVSKETPNILSETKVDRFFNSTDKSPPGPFLYPDDYRPRIIFGDYPYRFNISLQEVGESKPKYVGDTLPDSDYGFIRREVKIKHFSNATIDKTDVQKFKLYITPPDDDPNGPDKNKTWTSHDFAITINTTQLLNGNITDQVTNPNYDAAYRIDPRSDWINITIQDFDKKPPLPGWADLAKVEVNLTKVTFSQTRYGLPGLFSIPPGSIPQEKFTHVDGDPTPVKVDEDNPLEHLQTKQNITFAFPPGFFTAADPTGAIYINLTFEVKTTQSGFGPGMPYLNTSRTQPFDYNYNATDVTQPKLTDGVLEVAVW